MSATTAEGEMSPEIVNQPEDTSGVEREEKVRMEFIVPFRENNMAEAQALTLFESWLGQAMKVKYQSIVGLNRGTREIKVFEVPSDKQEEIRAEVDKLQQTIQDIRDKQSQAT